MYGSSSGSLPSRQVQMYDVATPLVVAMLLSVFYIHPPSSSPASFVLVFLLTNFPVIFPSITVFNSEFPLRVCPIHFFWRGFCRYTRDLSSPIVSNTSFVYVLSS